MNWVFEFGIQYLRPSFDSFSGIIVENANNSTQTQPVFGSVGADYPDQFQQILLVQTILEADSNWTLALKTLTPLNSLANIDTGSIDLPEYILYRSENQRPRIFLFSGINLSPKWRVGLGLDVGFRTETQASIFLQAGNGRYSDQRITAQVKPVFTPWVGVQYQDWALHIRPESQAKLGITADSAARVFGDIGAGINTRFSSESALFFLPWAFELEGRVALTPTWVVRPSVAYQQWSRYQAPAAVIQNSIPNNCNGEPGCTAQFSPGKSPEFQAQDIVVPALALDWIATQDKSRPDVWTLSGRYKPSIFKTTPSGFGNYLDPPRVDLGLQWRQPVSNGVDLSLWGQISRLMPQTVVKSEPTEIGAPGYSASGWLYGGGFSVSLALGQGTP